MTFPVRVETVKDRKFLSDLIEKNRLREQERESEKTFSPSALSECLRRVFLSKHHDSLEIPKVFIPRIETSFYFLKGEFIHLQWAYVIYKMAQKSDKIELAPDPIDSFEVRVASKRGDHRGTIDVIPNVLGDDYVVDFKGLNVRDFTKTSRGEVSEKYRIQLTDYMMILNSEIQSRYNVKDALLIVENKGGPDAHYPAALCEARISLAENKAEVRGRLEVLRNHEKEDTIPHPECVSTKSIQFQGCPFQGFCKKEVKAIENRRAKSRNTERLAVRVPEKRRSNRSR